MVSFALGHTGSESQLDVCGSFCRQNRMSNSVEIFTHINTLLMDHPSTGIESERGRGGEQTFTFFKSFDFAIKLFFYIVNIER